MRKVITFGTFDIFHIGHLNLLRRAREAGDYLCVGVSSDRLNIQKKNRAPVYTETERMAIIGSLRCVDHVFLEESLDLKRKYIEENEAHLLIMGDDWEGRFDDMPCEVRYIPRTPSVSTTQIIEVIRS